jgi:prepilin-type N-terminal cleavage/methylation domain-containing protein
MIKRIQARLRAEDQVRDAGFTLIELLIVVVILGVLAAIVVFSVTGLQNNSKTSACQTTVKTADTALEAYYAQKQTPAGSFGALVTGGFLHGDSKFTSTSGATVTDGNNIAYTIGAGSNAAGDVTASPTC